jgi:phage portal protein BeeE
MATRRDVARRTPRVAGLRAGVRSSRNDYAWLVDGWTPPAGPAPATEAQSVGLPPFGRGLELLANAVASTDWWAKRWDADLGVYQRLADQPSVLTDPYPISTVWSYRWAATEDAVLYGNHFALLGEVDYRTQRAGWIVPLPADQVWILQDPENGWWSWVVAGTELGVDELLHVPFGNKSGELLGRGKLSQYAEWLGGTVAAEVHAGAYFAGGALPPAVLQSPTVVTDEQAAQLKSKWREMTASREPVVLPQGYTLTPVMSNAEQAQLVESRTWNAETTAMLLGIPGWKLGLPGPSMTYQNVETADIDFVRDCVDRYARPLAAAFSKWLMPRGVVVEFDYAGRMRADQRTTADVLTTYTGAGLMTTDEARSMLGRPPLASTGEEGTTPAGVPELTPEEVTQ